MDLFVSLSRLEEEFVPFAVSFKSGGHDLFIILPELGNLLVAINNSGNVWIEVWSGGDHASSWIGVSERVVNVLIPEGDVSVVIELSDIKSLAENT